MNRWLIIGIMIACLWTMNIAYALISSTIYCLDNSTLIENITVYKDANVSSLMLPVYCDYGCDNITLACQIPTYQNTLLIIVCFIVFVIIGFWIIKKVSK